MPTIPPADRLKRLLSDAQARGDVGALIDIARLSALYLSISNGLVILERRLSDMEQGLLVGAEVADAVN